MDDILTLYGGESKVCIVFTHLFQQTGTAGDIKVVELGLRSKSLAKTRKAQYYKELKS